MLYLTQSIEHKNLIRRFDLSLRPGDRKVADTGLLSWENDSNIEVKNMRRIKLDNK